MKKHQAFLFYQQPEEHVKLTHSALAGAVWSVGLINIVSYKELCNHRNNSIYNQCTHGGKSEFGQLFQGFSLNNIDELNVLE